MRMRTFGEPDTTISEIGLRLTAEEQLHPEVLMAAFESGVNYFDAADGVAAELLTATLGELRHSVLLGAHASAASVGADCEASLARLNVARVGVLWVKAQSASEAELEQALAQVKGLQAEGRIQTFGFALAHLSVEEQIAAGQWAIETAGAPLVEMRYSLHEPQVGQALLHANREAHTAFVVALSKETTTLDKWLGDDLAEMLSTFARKTRQLRFLTDSGRSLAQTTIKFALAQPSVVCVLPPLNSLGALQNALAAADAPDLTPAELHRIEDLAAHGFHLSPSEPPSVYNG